MPGFVAILLLGTFIIGITSLITYEMLGFAWNKLPKLTIPCRLRVLLVIVPIFMVHIVNIWLYAGVYWILERYTAFGMRRCD